MALFCFQVTCLKKSPCLGFCVGMLFVVRTSWVVSLLGLFVYEIYACRTWFLAGSLVSLLRRDVFKFGRKKFDFCDGSVDYDDQKSL